MKKLPPQVRPLDPDTVVIGVTDMQYTGPGLYHCNLCDEPFNEGNKAQHLCSTRHRCNVSFLWKHKNFKVNVTIVLN